MFGSPAATPPEFEFGGTTLGDAAPEKTHCRAVVWASRGRAARFGLPQPLEDPGRQHLYVVLGTTAIELAAAKDLASAVSIVERNGLA